jgi:hypothetical protein
MRTFTRRYYAVAAIVLWTIACWTFFQFWYPYHFFFQEQNQLFLWSPDYIASYFETGGLALLIGDFLTQFYYYLYVGAIIQTLCIAAIGLMTYRTLRNFHAARPLALVIAISLMTFVAVCHFSTSYRLGSTVSIMGWTLALWLLSSANSNWLRLTLSACCLLLPTYLLFGLPQIKRIQKPDFILEKDFAADCEYYFGNYDKVIRLVESADELTAQMLFFYNLVQAQHGQLPDNLLKYTSTDLGTFHKIGPDTPMLTIRNMNELYWVLGDMTFTERAAMMTNVFSHNNRNVRMMRRLAECNIVSGDSLAAEKYLRILDKTLVYHRWAENLRQHGKDIYREKMKMVPQRDTITVSDNAHFLMMQLLDTNADNLVALDYILCSTLLLKDITNFKRDYDRYCTERGKPRLKTLYQEALCIWLAGTNASPEEWQKYIHRQDVLQRFQQYNSQRGNPAFKDTYWYYFDKIKAPEV